MKETVSGFFSEHSIYKHFRNTLLLTYLHFRLPSTTHFDLIPATFKSYTLCFYTTVCLQFSFRFRRRKRHVGVGHLQPPVVKVTVRWVKWRVRLSVAINLISSFPSATARHRDETKSCFFERWLCNCRSYCHASIKSCNKLQTECPIRTRWHLACCCRALKCGQSSQCSKMALCMSFINM